MSNETQQDQGTAADLQLCIGGFSSKGLKAENEDAFAAIVPDSHELRAKGAVAAIADGLSSANKAADASQLAVTPVSYTHLTLPTTPYV